MWIIAKSGRETSLGLIDCRFENDEMHGWYIAHSYGDKYIITTLLLTASDEVNVGNAQSRLQMLDEELSDCILLAKEVNRDKKQK